MKTAQQIQIEQVPIGELRPDPVKKRIEEINRAGIGIAGHIIYSFKYRNHAHPTRELSRVSQIKIRIDFRRLTPWVKEDQYRNPTN